MTEQARHDYDDYVNSEWKKTTIIPPDQVRWGAFLILQEDNMERLRTLCEEDTGVIGKVYNKALCPPDVISPSIKAVLKSIVLTVVDKDSYLFMAGKLFSMGFSTFIHMCKSIDDKNSDMEVPHIYQAGLGFADMLYYTDREDLHKPYITFISELLTLYGISMSIDEATHLFEFEKRKASLHLTKTQCRDNVAVYNKLEWSDVYNLMPLFYDQLSLPPMEYVIVQNPELMNKFPDLLDKTDPADLRNHLLFCVARGLAAQQTTRIRDRNFEFYGRLLGGQKEQKVDWKRALTVVSAYIPDMLGQLYVNRYFPESKRNEVFEMTEAICRALKDKLSTSTWMTEKTKIVALDKLGKIVKEIGYPSKYHSYEGLWDTGVDNKDLSQLTIEWCKWDWKTHECEKFYTLREKGRWFMSPQQVNAYYSPNTNSIAFPAGILQLPFYGLDTFEENMACIGVIIGHEVTHAFDDQGCRYNADGILCDWWQEDDNIAFKDRAQVVEKHYSRLTFMGKSVNGSLTLGENIADIGGLKLALWVLKEHYGEGINTEIYDRFFRAYADLWKFVITEQFAHQMLITDVHSPAQIRINGALSHIPEFYTTYNVCEGDGMYIPPEERMTIW